MLNGQTEKEVDDQCTSSPGDYERLRSLLLGDDYEKIIQQRLAQNNIDRFAEVISEAFRLRNQQDSSLSEEMSPVIEASIDTSIKNNPERITNIIFPIIGPAVRKAVSSALSDLMHSLNYFLQQSLTVRALAWRFKAWQLGISYGQYVLMHSIQYQVEQVFLIHRKSGVLIQSAVAEGIKYQDPDLVSSMLTAITDFANDSFNQDSESLNVLQFGSLNLLIESGPHAVIAFAVRGILSNDIRQYSSELLEKIHICYAKQLHSFDGDTTPFDSCIGWLQKALLKKNKSPERSRPWLAIIVLLLLSSLSSLYIYQKWQLNNSVQHVVDQINNQMGYQVLQQNYKNDELHLLILHSPLTPSIEDLLKKIRNNHFKIIVEEKLSSLDSPELYVPYLAQKYQSTLSTKREGQLIQLLVSGKISPNNLSDLKQDRLVKNYFNLVISKTLILTTNISVEAKNRLEVEALVNQINSQHFYFNLSSTQLASDSYENLNTTIAQIKRVILLEKLANISIKQISISGYSDNKGRKNSNLDLSSERAKLIESILKANGITESLIISWGYGAQDLPSVPSDRQRRARVEVLYIPNRVPHD